MEFYQKYAIDLFKSSKKIEVEVSKNEKYEISIMSQFKSGTNWAKLCDVNSKFILPDTSSYANFTMSFAGSGDYGALDFMMADLEKFMGEINKATGVKGVDFSGLMKKFTEAGSVQVVGGMELDPSNPKNMTFEVVSVAEDNLKMKDALYSWIELVSQNKQIEGIQFEKAGYKVGGSEAYTYNVKTPEGLLLSSQIVGNEQGLFYSTTKESLEKLANKKITLTDEKGLLYMRMDLSKSSPGLPVIEFNARTVTDSLFFNISF